MLSDSEMSCKELRIAINDTCTALEACTDALTRVVLRKHLTALQEVEAHRACRLLSTKED